MGCTRNDTGDRLYVLDRDRGSIFLFIALGFRLYGGVSFSRCSPEPAALPPTETGLTPMPGGIATAVAAIQAERSVALSR